MTVSRQASLSAVTEPCVSQGSFRVRLGRAENDLHAEVPVLAGEPIEAIFPAAAFRGESEDLRLFETDDLLLGCAYVPVGDDIAKHTEQLYRRLLEAVGGKHLYRVWNYVPGINRHVGNLEQYRAFCLGRSLAFEEKFGADYRRLLPAASAVGGSGRGLMVIFAAGNQKPRHIENPEQVPAYDYPDEHGPRSPSFSRATLAEAAGRRWVFVSGTAAIKGHTTIAVGDLRGQIECTLDNLKLISRECGLGSDLGAAGRKWTRHFKVYLRHAADLKAAQALLTGTLLQAGDRVTWLNADICRTALHIEIEATLEQAIAH